MADVSVTERARQQGRRLRQLRERADISKGLLMDRLGFKTSKAYDLYEEGTSVIRLDMLENWSDAFGMSVLAFVAEVVCGESEGDESSVTMMRFNHDWDEFQKQIESLPPEVREMAIRAFRESVAAMNAIGELARKN